MSRGIIEAQTLRSEQFEFEARTSDPGDAQPGEYWIRTDQTSTNPDVIAELRRQDTSGVTTCPIFAASEESNLRTDVTRGPSVVLDDGSVGFIVMTTGRGAVGSPRAVNSAGTQYVSHNALELSPIPDSAVAQYDATQLSLSDGDTVSTFTDSVGNNNASSNGNPTYQTNEQNGKPIVRYDGDGDYHDTGIVVDTTQDRSLILAVSLGGNNATHQLYGVDFFNESPRDQFGMQSGLNPQEYKGIYGNANVASGVQTSNTFEILSLVASGGSLSLYQDGNEILSTTYNGFGEQYGSNLIGARKSSSSGGVDAETTMDLGEAVEYDAALSNPTRQQEEQRLADKWGVSL